MLTGPSSRSIARPNKVGGGYSRPSPGRVSGGDRGAVLRIFRLVGGSRGGSMAAGSGWFGVKVGREKSVDPSITHAFPPFSGRVRLMGRWRGPFSAARRGRPGAPLGVAATSGHPVARSGSEIWKTSARSAAINLFLPYPWHPNENWPANGSGCGRQARSILIKRVGVRLNFAGKARFASILGLSGPELEAATLGGGCAGVN